MLVTLLHQPHTPACSWPSALTGCRSFIKQEGHGPAICPGEWGGWAKEGGSDAAWQVKLADWFVEHGITDSFYWCLNPNSGDTVRPHSTAWKNPGTSARLNCVTSCKPGCA